MQLSICAPILLVISLPILLWALAKPPFRIFQPGLRFKLASTIILLTWVAFCRTMDLWYWGAGLLFILACLLFAFMVWSVLCWGYTLCMLLSLDEHREPVDSDQWQKLHAGPHGTRQLTLDRVQVLVKLHLATFDGNQIVISRSGACLAVIARIFTNVFGIKL